MSKTQMASQSGDKFAYANFWEVKQFGEYNSDNEQVVRVQGCIVRWSEVRDIPGNVQARM